MANLFNETYDITTGKTTKKDLTQAELDTIEAQQAENALIQSPLIAKAAATATAKAELLARLGITADEAKLLIE